MRFLSMGALALSLAALPTQHAAAAGYSRLSIGFNFCWEHYGCGHDTERCVSRHHGGHAQQHPGYVVVMPGQAHAQPQPMQWQQAPPPMPDRRPPERRQEEPILQWGYPGLGYSYYHPVSYDQSQPAPNETPTYYYYVPQSYYPANYGYPGYYQTPGVTFDR